MPFIRTDRHDPAKGYLACDWYGCRAQSKTFRWHLGPLPVEGWHVVARTERMRALVEYFCNDHVPAARARRAA